MSSYCVYFLSIHIFTYYVCIKFELQVYLKYIYLSCKDAPSEEDDYGDEKTYENFQEDLPNPEALIQGLFSFQNYKE